MIIHPFLRNTALASLAIAGLAGCNQGQGLALREEFQKQMSAKDKTIEDLNQKVTELRGQIDQLQLQTAKSGSGDPDKLAGAVADLLSKQLAQQGQAIAEIKNSVEQLSQGMGRLSAGGGSAPAAPGSGPDNGGPVKPTLRPPQDNGGFPKAAPKPAITVHESGGSSTHPGAVKEIFEFPK